MLRAHYFRIFLRFAKDLLHREIQRRIFFLPSFAIRENLPAQLVYPWNQRMVIGGEVILDNLEKYTFVPYRTDFRSDKLIIVLVVPTVEFSFPDVFPWPIVVYAYLEQYPEE